MTNPTWPTQGGPWFPAPQVASVAPSHSRLFTTALLVATMTSIVSTLSFIVYVLVGVFAGAAQQAHLSVLYQIGIIGLYVAGGCQILGVVVLIRQWFSRNNINRKPRELIVLLLSLIPYMLAVVFLITLIVYLRARRDPASQRTREAKQELKEQAVDALIDAGANTMNSASATPFAPAAAGGSQIAPGGAPAAPANLSSQTSVRPQANLRDAVRQVIGPSTSKQLSQTAQGVITFAMIVLLISAVVSVGVGIPAKLITLAGNWALALTNCTPPCVNGVENDVLTIQQSGGALTAIGTNAKAGEGGVILLKGTVTGNDIVLEETSVVSGTTCFTQFTGKITSANQMDGPTQESCTSNGQQQSLTATWTATRTSSAGGATVNSLVGAWKLVLAHCSTCGQKFYEGYTMTIQQSGNTLTAKASYFGCTTGAGCALPMTVTVSGTNVGLNGHYAGNGCQIILTGKITSAYQMNGTISFLCSKQYTGGAWTALRG